MATKLRLLSAICALVAAVVVVWQSNPATTTNADRVQLRSTSAPMSGASTTIKWPVVPTTDPSPFDPCDQIPM